MIFAAGMGTRLKPLTDSKPKALVEVNGIPLLEINIKRLISFGFNEIIVNVHHFSDQVTSFLKGKNNFGITIHISDETQLLLDTGGGLKKAGQFIHGNEPLLVHNVDILSNIDLVQLYQKHITNNCIATLACMDRQSSREFLIDENNVLCGWRNNKTGELKISRENKSFLSPTSFSGIHVINPSLFNNISESGVFSIVNVYLRLAKAYDIFIEKYNDSVWIDLGTPENLEKARCMKTKLNIL